MDHGFYGVGIQFVDKNGIIVMDKRPNRLINSIAKKQGLVVEVNFDIHDNKDKIQGTRLNAQETRTINLKPYALNLVPLYLAPCAFCINFAP